MSTKYFVFLYPDKGVVKSLLDLSIFLLNPDEKWPAHITVAGPFRNRRGFNITAREYRSNVAIFGASNFFKNGSPTIYFNAQLSQLDEIWRKPDYPFNRIPHLTLYSGDDLDYAHQIFEMISKRPRKFSFTVKGLHVVQSKSGQLQTDLRQQVDLSADTATAELALDDVKHLTKRERIELAEAVLNRIPTNYRPTVLPGSW